MYGITWWITWLWGVHYQIISSVKSAANYIRNRQRLFQLKTSLFMSILHLWTTRHLWWHTVVKPRINYFVDPHQATSTAGQFRCHGRSQYTTAVQISVFFWLVSARKTNTGVYIVHILSNFWYFVSEWLDAIDEISIRNYCIKAHLKLKSHGIRFVQNNHSSCKSIWIMYMV